MEDTIVRLFSHKTMKNELANLIHHKFWKALIRLNGVME